LAFGSCILFAAPLFEIDYEGQRPKTKDQRPKTKGQRPEDKNLFAITPS
jgi:hypothetical protein